MSNVFSGSCLCGTVEFEITGAFESFFLCHCSRCRKGSGSAHASNLFSTSASISWLNGEDQIKRYQLPKTRHEKCFCLNCGSPLPKFQSDIGLLVVPAGSLDSTVDIQPDAHICYANRADWDEDLWQVVKLEGLPG
jgi:hypothetical protein